VAGISHLPLALAASLVNTVSADIDWPTSSRLAAGGFRDTSRVASGSPDLGVEILSSNRKHIAHLIKKFEDELKKLRLQIHKGDKVKLLAYLKQAKATRNSWLTQRGVTPNWVTKKKKKQ
jgi:prephenate dehydrogenase